MSQLQDANRNTSLSTLQWPKSLTHQPCVAAELPVITATTNILKLSGKYVSQPLLLVSVSGRNTDHDFRLFPSSPLFPTPYKAVQYRQRQQSTKAKLPHPFTSPRPTTRPQPPDMSLATPTTGQQRASPPMSSLPYDMRVSQIQG